jgi:hypothetical protein
MAGAGLFALAAQRLPAQASAIDVTAEALRVALAAAWVVVLAWNAVECWIAQRSGQPHSAWRQALLVAPLAVVRLRGDVLAAPVALFWLTMLAWAGAWLVRRAMRHDRTPRGYWVGAAIAVAPWALLPRTPAWP